MTSYMVADTSLDIIHEDYVASWDTEKRRTSTLSTQIWKMTQSNATKAENLAVIKNRSWGGLMKKSKPKVLV